MNQLVDHLGYFYTYNCPSNKVNGFIFIFMGNARIAGYIWRYVGVGYESTT